jgi:hypothetical protein
MSDRLAAVFFSNLTLILIGLSWVVLFRGLRMDLLRVRLRSLQIELERLPRSDAHTRLWNRISCSIESVEYLTLTRFSCCFFLGRGLSPHRTAGPSAADARLAGVEERLLNLTANYVTAGLPLFSPVLKKNPGWLDLILETCPASPPGEASRQ